MGDVILGMEGVVAGYGSTTVLHGTDLEVRRDAISTVIGPNGAGKSTALKAVFGMLRVRSGHIRYEGEDGWPNLELNNSTSNGSVPYIGKLSVLLQWTLQDPPDTFEKRRNQVIYDTWQHNRNPFIDHPEWAGAIWG